MQVYACLVTAQVQPSSETRDFLVFHGAINSKRLDDEDIHAAVPVQDRKICVCLGTW